MKDATEGRRNLALALAWPVDLAQQEDGSVLVTCPDIPEALTEGRSEDDALAQARDCLAAALGGYVAAGRAVPRPSPSRGRPMVAPPVLAAAKVALYDAMRDQGLGSDALAERLGIGEDEVRRLLDLDRRSPIGQVEAALHAPVLTGLVAPGGRVPVDRHARSRSSGAIPAARRPHKGRYAPLARPAPSAQTPAPGPRRGAATPASRAGGRRATAAPPPASRAGARPPRVPRGRGDEEPQDLDPANCRPGFPADPPDCGIPEPPLNRVAARRAGLSARCYA